MVKKYKNIRAASFWTVLLTLAFATGAGLADEVSLRNRMQDAVAQIESGVSCQQKGKTQEALEKYDQAFKILSSLQKEPYETKRIEYLLFVVAERIKECGAPPPLKKAPPRETVQKTAEMSVEVRAEAERPKRLEEPRPPLEVREAPEEAPVPQALEEAIAPPVQAGPGEAPQKEFAQPPAPEAPMPSREAPREQGAWVVAKERQELGFDLTEYTADPGIRFSFAGDTFSLEKPSPLRKASDIWVPVSPFLQKVKIMFLRIDEQNFALIRDDGIPLELKVGDTTVKFRKAPYLQLERPPASYEGAFFLSLESLAKVLNASQSYNPSTNTADLSRAQEEEFTTYTLPKPPEPAAEKKKEELKILPHEPTDIRQEFLPPEYARDVDLKVDMSATYLHDQFAHDRTREAEWYITGKAYDYTIDGHFRMKDFRTQNKQRFKEDGEFLGIYTKELWCKFFDNYFTIPTLRSQSQSYFGTEVTTLPPGPFKGTVLYGRTDNTMAGPAAIGAVRYYGDMFAVRETYTSPAKRFITQGTVITEANTAETEGKSSWTVYPRRNIVFVTENTVSPYEGAKLHYSHAVCSYVPDNRVNAHLTDHNWRAAAEYAQPQYAFKAGYEYVGNQYASIGIPATYQDYSGWDFSTSYKFTKNWSADIAARLARNNVGRNPRRQTSYDRNLTASSSLGLPWEQNVSTSWTLNESFTKGGDLDMSGNRYQDWRVDYSKVWGNMSAQLSYDHYTLEAFAAAVGGSITDMFSFSLFDSYPELNGSYVRWVSNYRKTKTIANASYTTEGIDTSVGGRLNILRNLSLNADWRVSITRREAYSDTAMMTLIVGGEFKSSPVTTFNFDFSLTDFDLYKRKTWLPKHYTMLFRGRHVFDVATPEKWGKVQVFVYRDLNSNGRYDPSEPCIPKVRVYVVNGRAAYTNERGYALIEKVIPGERQAKVDLTRIPIDLYVRGPSVKPVTVEPLRTVKIDFPLVKTGHIRGRVYIDKNNNGTYDKFEDEPIPNARVYLSPEVKDTLTFSDGTYSFDYIYPGDYNVCVDLRGPVVNYRLISPEKIPVKLKEEEKLTDLDFKFASKPIQMDYFGSE